MTAKEYFEGLGHSPAQAEVLAKESAARYQKSVLEACDQIEDGCIYVDPDTALEQEMSA